MSENGAPIEQIDGFFPSPFPFQDFCFFQTKDCQLAAKLEEQFKILELNLAKTELLGWNYAGSLPFAPFLLSGWGKIGEIVFWGKQINRTDAPKDDDLLGVVVPSGSDVMRDDAPKDDILLGEGNYVCFESQRDKIVASTDFFGMGALFICNAPEIRVVANRGQLAAICAYHANARELNMPRIKASLLVGTFFTYDLGMPDSPLLGIERIASEKYVIMDKNGILLQNRPILCFNRGYEEYLEQGARDISDLVHRLQKEATDKQFIFDLSGGKDSRLSIAPFITENQIIHTNDIGNDLEVSIDIASVFPNLQYVDEVDNRLERLSFEENLQAWRSYNFGYYHALNLYQTACRGMPDIIRITGGGGEYYRIYNTFAKPSPRCSLAEWIDSILDKESFLAALKNEEDKNQIREFVKGYIIENFGAYAHEDDSMHQFYRTGRGRSHFGNVLYAFWIGPGAITPSLNKNLYLAKELLATSDNIEARLLYDYVRLCNEILANLPYERQFPYQDRKKRFVTESMPERRNKALDQYAKAKIKKREKWEKLLAGKKGDSSHPEDLLINLVLQAAARIISFEPSLENFLRYAIHMLHTCGRKRDRYVLASKILAVDDYLFPLTSMKQANFDESTIEDMISHIVGYTIKGEELEIRMRDNVNSNEYRFALYLHSNNQKLASFAYQDSPFFNINGYKGQFGWVTLFAKSKHSGNKHITVRTIY